MDRLDNSSPVEKREVQESKKIVLISTLVVHHARSDSSSNNISRRKLLFQSGLFKVTNKVRVDFSNLVESVV